MEMSDSLAKAGIKGAYEGALKFVGNPELISRTHFARFLVETGVCRETNEVFRKYLTEGKPGYVPHRWATLRDAVTWITQAQGVAVIAHPGRYKFTPNEEYALFTEFKSHGGRGVEVVTGSHTPQEYRQIRRNGERIRPGRLARQRLPQPRREPHRPGHPALPAGRTDAGVGTAGGPHPVMAGPAKNTSHAPTGIALLIGAVGCFAVLDTTTKVISQQRAAADGAVVPLCLPGRGHHPGGAAVARPFGAAHGAPEIPAAARPAAAVHQPFCVLQPAGTCRWASSPPS